MTTTSNEPEQRGSERRRVLLQGLLVHGAELFTTPCAVRDLSDTGAQARLSTLMHVVEPAALLVSRLDRAWHIKVARQRGVVLGLTLLREINLRAPATDEPDRTVRRIWGITR